MTHDPPPPQPVSPPAAAGQQWTGRTKGGSALFQVCAFLLPLVGARGAWVGSWLIGGGFVAAGGRDLFGMAAYWRRLRPGVGWLRLRILCLRHFSSFGRVLCDRLLVALRPGDYRFEYHNGEVLRAAVGDGRGCILLSAHLGNWELSGHWLKHLTDAGKPAYLVMVRDDHPAVQRFVDQHMRGAHLVVIDPRDGLSAALAIRQALQGGHAVCMLGDRVFGNQPATTATFLGGEARFPLGPFQSAALTGAPIVVCFLVKTGLRSYRFEIDRPWHVALPPRGPGRERALQATVQRWAKRLELQARRHPFQWHNFFPYWRAPVAPGPGPRRAQGARRPG